MAYQNHALIILSLFVGFINPREVWPDAPMMTTISFAISGTGNSFSSMRTIALLIFSLMALPVFAALNTNQIQQAIGIKGAWNAAEGVFKITSPRTDVKVSVDGWV